MEIKKIAMFIIKPMRISTNPEENRIVETITIAMNNREHIKLLRETPDQRDAQSSIARL